MTATIEASPLPALQNTAKATALALRLARAERALQAHTSGQVDAIVDSDGKAYLLRPAQERLRQSEAHLQAVFDSSADIITLVSSSGVILSESRAAFVALGYWPIDLVGKIFFDFVHREDLPHLYSMFFNVLEEFLPNALVEFRCQTRMGSYLPVEATISRLRESGTSCAVLICRDTTRRHSDQKLTTAVVAENTDTCVAEAA